MTTPTMDELAKREVEALREINRSLARLRAQHRSFDESAVLIHALSYPTWADPVLEGYKDWRFFRWFPLHKQWLNWRTRRLMKDA